MSEKSDTSLRKKDHIQICLNDEVDFKHKTSGLEHYDFEHNAITEVDINKIDLTSKFFGERINYPFVISCMTGGTQEALGINSKLAEVAYELKIPMGVGSQRQALENGNYLESYKVIKKYADGIPLMGNIGAAQVAKFSGVDEITKLVDMIEAKAIVIHLNPLQEIIQKEGEPNFNGLLKSIEKIAKTIKVPIITKEVGSGISRAVARKLLEAGVRGIDVAGAGGTSWSAIEAKRNEEEIESCFRDWGLPTTYCIKEVKKLKKNFFFALIASGGITNGEQIAKAIALGADLVASAKPLLKSIVNGGVEETTKLIDSWFLTVKRIMYLTGADNLKELKKVKVLKKRETY
ncbi:MAG: type 2 isopentenyl-diphosphate Delta-isomerase [Ignavibacteria bacterium]|jgi:isopentenyl-diphosphate delta-isomerase